MVSPQYTIVSDNGEGLAGASVIFSDGTVLNANSGQGNYPAILLALTTGAEEEEVRDLMRPHLTAGKSLKSLSERVRFDEGTIYFDGDAIDNSLAKHIVRIIGEGGDENKYGALVKFLENLYTNPSEKSRKSLYDFLLRQNIAITPRGTFIAYKGVNADGTSINAGYGIVNGVAFEHANLLNEVGSVIEIPRSKVDDNSAVGCSTGLHAGSYAYAKDFARGLLLTVEVNPRDVVSVPDDCNFQKIRTCRYVVLDTTVQEITTTTYVDRDTDNDWEPDYDDEDYDDEYEYCDNCGAEVERGELNEDGYCDYCIDELREDDEDDEVEVTVDSNRAGAPVQGLALLDAILDADNSVKSAQDGSRPTVDEFYAQIVNEIEDGEEDIVLSFTYTKNVDGWSTRTETTTVAGFRPTSAEKRGNDVLVVGKLDEGGYRSYYYSKMANVTARLADSNGGKHSA